MFYSHCVITFRQAVDDGEVSTELGSLKMTHITTYQQITQALTVLDLAEPVTFRFDKATAIADVLSELGENIHTSGIILVEDQERPIGFITSSSNFENSDQNYPVGTIAEKIDSRQVLSSNLSLYNLMPLWKREEYPYFILNGAEITHFISKDHMDSAPVKTALFAMTAEFEDLILKLLTKDLTKIKERFERLPTGDTNIDKANNLKNNQEAAKRCAKRKGLPNNSFAHIQSTFLSHKIDILLLDTELCEFAFPGSDHTILENNLTFISRFRNEIAHGGSIFNIVRNLTQLNDIVDLLESAIIDLSKKLNKLSV